jgi:glutamate-1-semialdehyde 2,1-aminomutase
MTRSFEESHAYQERACKTLAGGVATAFRAAQLPIPICFERGSGSHIWDIDGNEYIDYALAFGPLLLGHSPRAVLDSVRKQLERGLGYGACHRLEAELSEAVCRTAPSAELCVFSSTGSEAVHAAIRIARAATGRTKVVKFLGHYNGWYDPIHVGVPPQLTSSLGTAGQDPRASASLTVCSWNDVDALATALDDEVAAVIMEPVNVNGGCIAPAPGYLEHAAKLTREAGAVLIFDEVITGYRLALGGAQERYAVTPDLTVLGKALGAGFVISAVCGRADLMEVVASRTMAHVGTFNANPVCVAAALAAITTLEDTRDAVYLHLADYAASLAEIFKQEGKAAGIPLHVNHDVGLLYAFISEQPVESYVSSHDADAEAFRRFSAELLVRGVHVIPRGLIYVSTEHTSADLERTRQAVAAAAAAFAQGRVLLKEAAV